MKSRFVFSATSYLMISRTAQPKVTQVADIS